MAERFTNVVILCEDLVQARFAYRYLIRLNPDNRPRVINLPAGKGSGEQHVRKHFPREVQAHRQRAATTRSVLVVVIDADVREVRQRMTHLASYLKVAGINARKSDDSIAILIPKRHIETWILCLAGETVDEATDYKRTRGEQELASKIGSAAETLFAWTRPKARVPRACVPSLQVALPELARLE